MLTPYEIIWLFAMPAAALSWYHIFKNIRGFIPPEQKIDFSVQPKIIFSIAARKLSSGLQKPVQAIQHSCTEIGLTNYEIKLVVDEMGSPIDGAETILVPKEFTCKSKYKARALHYALGFLPDSKEVWTLHLDEDALVTPQCVSNIINYIQKGGNPVANGPSLFPYDGNLLTFYAESQRHWTFYWLMDQERTSVIHWLNGSNLLIRSDIEHAVGWDFVNCFISEDARFGYEATKKLGKVFGWHGGLTIETPPASVNSVFKQRTRWFYGSILNLRYVPKARLPRRLYSIAAWLDGFILTLFLVAIIIPNSPWRHLSNPFFGYGLSVSALLWVSRYQIGVYQNLRFSPLSKLKKALLHIGIIPLAPVSDFICNFPTVLALIKRPKAFEITAKRG